MFKPIILEPRNPKQTAMKVGVNFYIDPHSEPIVPALINYTHKFDKKEAPFRGYPRSDPRDPTISGEVVPST